MLGFQFLATVVAKSAGHKMANFMPDDSSGSKRRKPALDSSRQSTDQQIGIAAALTAAFGGQDLRGKNQRKGNQRTVDAAPDAE